MIILHKKHLQCIRGFLRRFSLRDHPDFGLCTCAVCIWFANNLDISINKKTKCWPPLTVKSRWISDVSCCWTFKLMVVVVVKGNNGGRWEVRMDKDDWSPLAKSSSQNIIWKVAMLLSEIFGCGWNARLEWNGWSEGVRRRRRGIRQFSLHRARGRFQPKSKI